MEILSGGFIHLDLNQSKYPFESGTNYENIESSFKTELVEPDGKIKNLFKNSITFINFFLEYCTINKSLSLFCEKEDKKILAIKQDCFKNSINFNIFPENISKVFSELKSALTDSRISAYKTKIEDIDIDTWNNLMEIIKKRVLSESEIGMLKNLANLKKIINNIKKYISLIKFKKK